MSRAAAPLRRISAMRRLSLLHGLGSVLAFALFLLGGALIIQAKNIERARALADADVESLMEKIGSGPALLRTEKAKAIVLTRSARGDPDRLYSLTTADGRYGVNLSRVRERAQAGGWVRLSGLPPSKGGASNAQARPVDLGGGARLLVGRRVAPIGVETDLLRLALLAMGLTIAAAVLIGPWFGMRLLRRVEAVNAACLRVEQGELQARAPGDGAPDEFGELARHVNGMLERIHALVLGLRDVSNRIAHDLRTPVARLKGDLEAVARSRDLAEAQGLAAAAALASDEILQTFEALLDIAEVEAGSDRGLKPMDLADAVRATLELYGAVAEDRGLHLVADAQPTPILGERSLIVQLVANLVDNALKFSPVGGTVAVSCTVDGSQAVLVVSDVGAGVPVADRDRIFRRFTRGADVAGVPGHGLGLALVAAVAKRHGARICLADAGPGLQVTLRFQAYSATGPVLPEGRGPERNGYAEQRVAKP